MGDAMMHLTNASHPWIRLLKKGTQTLAIKAFKVTGSHSNDIEERDNICHLEYPGLLVYPSMLSETPDCI